MLSAAGAGVGAAAGPDVGIFGGDVMQPVLGNDNGFFFADFMGDGATGNTFLVSPGLGYRQVVQNQIWGAYFFGDNERVNLGKNFWNLSPGIEWMSPHWDAHVNGYFPLPQAQKMGGAVFADTLGDYDSVNFVPGTHNQYNALTAPYDVIGNGGDVEIAYRFAAHKNLSSRVYVGGYFYQPASAIDFTSITAVKNITGITAGFEQSLTKNIRVWLMNSYDSLNHYTIGVRLQLTFGDESTIYSNDVHSRLLEPIERHVGIIETGAGTYDQVGYKNLGNALQYNNVYFFSPNGGGAGLYLNGAGDGTYGNPMALAQNSLNAVNSQSPNSARLYLQGGSGATYVVNGTTATTNLGLLLYNGQDLYGRSATYTTPAASSERPVISVDGVHGYNGFIINSGENTFNDLVITASSTNGTTTGIDVTTNSNATVNVVNTSITALNKGLYAENDNIGTLTINASNSSFSDNTVSPAPSDVFGAFGIYANNVSTGTLTVNATNSLFNDNTVTSGNNGNQAFGIYANNDSAGTVIINTINSSFNGNANSGQYSNGAAGIAANNNAIGNLTINATNSSFNGNTNTGNSNQASGISVYNNGAGTLTINASNSQFNDNSSTLAEVNGLSVNATAGNVNLNLNSSSFNGNTVVGQNNGSAYGVFIDVQNLNMTITNSTFNGNINDSQNSSIGGLASGLYAQTAGTASIKVNKSQFNGNQAINGAGVDAIGFVIINSGAANVAVDVSDSQFNDNVATGDNNGGTYGLYAANDSSGLLTISATQSQFNGNTASGTNNGGAYGFCADNSYGSGLLAVTNLFGSSFANNSSYGLYALGSTTSTTTVNLYGTSFYGNPTNVGSMGNVTFTP